LNVVLDIGNSLLKAGLFKNNKLVKKYNFEVDYYKNIKNLLETNDVSCSIVSNVSNPNKKLINLLNSRTKLIKFNTDLNVPFINKYKTKKTLGDDRVALITSALIQYPNENVLIIDLGSCITYDLIKSNKEYVGGAISPGLKMRYKSLNTFTSNLPLLEPKDVNYLTGKNTEESIHSGVINGIIGELNNSISQYKSDNKEIKIILTGGDSKFLFNKIKNSIFATSNFLLLGLNFLIELNKK
jgi:type III pantothenate kinase